MGGRATRRAFRRGLFAVFMERAGIEPGDLRLAKSARRFLTVLVLPRFGFLKPGDSRRSRSAFLAFSHLNVPDSFQRHVQSRSRRCSAAAPGRLSPSTSRRQHCGRARVFEKSPDVGPSRPMISAAPGESVVGCTHGRLAIYTVSGDVQELARSAEEGMLPIFQALPGFKAHSRRPTTSSSRSGPGLGKPGLPADADPSTRRSGTAECGGRRTVGRLFDVSRSR